MLENPPNTQLIKILKLSLWAILLVSSGCGISNDDQMLFREMPPGDLPSTGKTYGACILDLNGDNFPDLLLSTHSNTPSLYQWQGQSSYVRFESNKLPTGIFDQHGSAACDFNNDGLWDTYISVGAHRGNGWSHNQLWRGRSDEGFDNIAIDFAVLADSVGRGRGALWADFDRDATPELLVLNYRSPIRLLAQRRGSSWRDETYRFPVVPDYPYWARNNILPSPEERSASSWSHNACIGDINNDGWTDLYIVGKQGTSGIWLNNAEGVFQDRTSNLGLKTAAWPHTPIHTALGDVDEDGDLDLLLAYRPDQNVRPRRHPLELRFNDLNASQKFKPALNIACIPEFVDPQACILADLDNDGHLDIYLVIRNDNEPGLTNTLLRGHGNGKFDDLTQKWGGAGPIGGAFESAIALDMDLDGDLDLITFNGGSSSDSMNHGVVCYENTSTQMKGVTLVLSNPTGPAHGLGARVYCDGQMREVRSVATPFNSSILPIHFGLGKHVGPVAIVIQWPGSNGATFEQIVTLPTAGATYKIIKGRDAIEQISQAVGS